MAEAEARYELARAELDEEVKRLNEKRRKLEQKHRVEIAGQRGKRDRAAQAYRTAVKNWQATTD